MAGTSFRLSVHSFSLLTRGLITAGFGQELVDHDDLRARQLLAPLVEDLRAPRAINALLAALLFYPLASIEIEDGNALPTWLLEELRSL